MGRVQHHILKEKEIFVGLEDSKRSWKLCVRSAGVIVHETSMPAKFATLRGYFHNKFPDCKIHLIYEAGFRGFGLHDQIVDQGWNCIVTPPHTVTEEKCQRQKNDRVDSRRLAKNLENNDYRKCFVPDKQLREDRQVSRTYGQIQRDIVRVCNRIRRTLEFHGIDEKLAAGRWTRSQYRILADGIDHMGLSDTLRFSLQIMFNELKQLWLLRTQVLKQLRVLAKKEQYKQTVEILKSAPGIGPLTSIRLALEWGDLRRFNRKEDFSSFLGLIPREYSSGEQERKGHITKQGNRDVRAWLTECSWVAIRYDAALLDKFYAVFKNSGSKKKAIVAVARKLAIRLRALLLTRQPYVIGKLE